jgi:hypothetical protein
MKAASCFITSVFCIVQEQEDMALQIAQMIISDVTSVTQAIGAMQTFDPPPDS